MCEMFMSASGDSIEAMTGVLGWAVGTREIS